MEPSEKVLEAQYQVSVDHVKNQNYEEAFNCHHKLATDQGFAKSQYQLGLMYEKGFGVIDKNESESFKWYTMAAKQNHADAQLRLGLMYAAGVKNFEEAVKWLTLSADQGHAIAEITLGEIKGAENNKSESI